jgi:hypothetical protein
MHNIYGIKENNITIIKIRANKEACQKSEHPAQLSETEKSHIAKYLTNWLSLRKWHLPFSMSTSSNTTIGLLPPSSSVTGCQENMQYNNTKRCEIKLL